VVPFVGRFGLLDTLKVPKSIIICEVPLVDARKAFLGTEITGAFTFTSSWIVFFCKMAYLTCARAISATFVSPRFATALTSAMFALGVKKATTL